MIKFIIHVVGTIVQGLSGLKAIDPIEVFYLPDHDIIYPMLSKSGCSSVKLKVIRYFAPSFSSKFPEIHRVFPEGITNGQVHRLMFYRKSQYHQFCSGKTVKLIIRNPYERYYSFYTDVTSGRNVMYSDPSNLERVVRIPKTISWSRLMKIACLVPDYISDRHFRTQSYYADANVKRLARKLEVVEISRYIANGSVVAQDPSGSESGNATIHLNKSKSLLPEDKIKDMISSSLFRWKYGEDLKLYQQTVGGLT